MSSEDQESKHTHQDAIAQNESLGFPVIADNKISDVVRFSLCSLSAIRLKCLYPESYHESFRTSTIKRIVEYFGLPNRVEQSVQEFFTEDEFTFLSSIKQNQPQRTFKLIEELILISISTGTYDARMHYLVIDVAELLGIPRDLVEMHCENIYELLLKAQKEAADEANDPESEKYRERRDARRKIKKYLIIGLASLGGGAVIGVTGGLAAPFVASAFGAAIGAGTIVMSSAAAGVVGSVFGVAGAGLTASKMNKRIGDLEEFSFQSLNPDLDQTSLTITIAISGWITETSEDQFSKPWKSLQNTREQYCLRYESKYLLELSQAMDYILSFVVSYAAQEALKYTFLASVMAAIAWPTALISMSNIIDNPWDVCIGRSAEAGKHLADVLMSRQQGRRPVSLIGFSLGARVIYFCLQELAQRKNSEGIICDVVLLGAPVTASLDQWQPLGRVISGRVINGYSSSDWMLKFLYRTSSAAIRVAGLQELCWHDKRVKNINLTNIVSGHMDYYKKLTEILDFINIKTVVKIEDDLVMANVATSIGDEDDEFVSAEAAAAAESADLSAALSSASDSGICRSASEATNYSSCSPSPVRRPPVSDPRGSDGKSSGAKSMSNKIEDWPDAANQSKASVQIPFSMCAASKQLGDDYGNPRDEAQLSEPDEQQQQTSQESRSSVELKSRSGNLSKKINGQKVAVKCEATKTAAGGIAPVRGVKYCPNSQLALHRRAVIGSSRRLADVRSALELAPTSNRMRSNSV